MSTRDRLQNQGGFALVSAIFILVVLGAMGAFMLTMSGVQIRTAIFAIRGAQAYHAARSGVEWGIYTVVNSGCSNTSLTVEGFTVAVTCTDLGSFNEGSDSFNIYRLTSRAESGSYGSIDYVQRTMVADVTDL
jgi:MSHA biogenesis protein MshP